MACPFFAPADRLSDDLWILPPRLPLNGAHRGVCHAGPEPFEPPEKSQRELCNCGYARGRCERFPASTPADAVRFSILEKRDGIVQLVYIRERDYSPIEHGRIEYSIDGSELRGEVPLILAAQARAFLTAYLLRAQSAGAGC